MSGIARPGPRSRAPESYEEACGQYGLARQVSQVAFAMMVGAFLGLGGFFVFAVLSGRMGLSLEDCQAAYGIGAIVGAVIGVAVAKLLGEDVLHECEQDDLSLETVLVRRNVWISTAALFNPVFWPLGVLAIVAVVLLMCVFMLAFSYLCKEQPEPLTA